MMKLYKKRGFSIAESLISMMIMVLSIMLTMTAITNKKIRQTKEASNTGVYACWYDGTHLNQKLYKNNVRDTSIELHPSNCSFPKDRRVDEYFMYIVGKTRCEDTKCSEGQVRFKHVLKYATQEDASRFGNIETVDINLANNLDDYTTVVLGNNNEFKTLNGSKINEAGIVAKNIDSCTYYGHPDDEDWDECGVPKCIVSGNDGDIFKFDSVTTITLECSNSGVSYSYDINDNTPSDWIKVQNENKGVYNFSLENGKHAYIKINEKDPFYKAKEISSTKDTVFMQTIKKLPAKTLNNTLIKSLLKFLDSNRDAEMNGIVLIVW